MATLVGGLALPAKTAARTTI